ncbi:MAG: redox-active disulfide protein [Omnitrophica WOR_2 bacterium RIFOXYC2_FULL_38_12]|nr:MAG: redox-active disulfide protein [Omnitrophica WOR_2 bacterium RIFOXYC2_FULL_38_12]
MKIEVLGMGCPKCKQLLNNVQKAVDEKGIVAELVKVEDMDKITEYGVMMTPALVLDGVVKVAGKVPSVEEIKGLL